MTQNIYILWPMDKHGSKYNNQAHTIRAKEKYKFCFEYFVPILGLYKKYC